MDSWGHPEPAYGYHTEKGEPDECGNYPWRIDFRTRTQNDVTRYACTICGTEVIETVAHAWWHRSLSHVISQGEESK